MFIKQCYYSILDGQNYILQHSSVPNIGVSMPVAKVVTPVLTTSPTTAKGSKMKKSEVSGVAIAINTAGVDWTQQNWNPHLVTVSDQFSSQVWNITQ